MEWSGRASAPPAIEAGKRRFRNASIANHKSPLWVDSVEKGGSCDA
jgi:hypothetical protein